MEKIIYFGIDVDDKSFHATGLTKAQEKFSFKCRPTAAHLAAKLQMFEKQGYTIKACYEATYLGFSLQRQLSTLGINADVIAPSSVPKPGDRQVKNDRIDADQLAQYFLLDLLTIVKPPNPEFEVIRDLARTRQFLMGQIRGLKNHLNAICRRQGWNFTDETDLKTKWTTMHRQWLVKRLNENKDPMLEFNVSQLLKSVDSLTAQIENYSEQIRIIAQKDEFKKPVTALSCFRGIDNLSALSIVTEIGDVKRFSHPRQLMSYVGLDVREYSSGGIQKQFGITKLGNKYLRKILVESSQTCYKRPRVSWELKKRREPADKIYVEIADKCMSRLHKKSTRMLFAGKNSNKVKVACAREMMGFIWEALNKAV